MSSAEAAERVEQPEILPVTPERWPDMVELFERPGPRGGRPVSSGCWCMYWRLDGKTFDHFWGRGDERGQENKRQMEGIVAGGRVPGLLAYVDGRPAGWVSVAPRSEFPRIEKSRALKPVDDRPAWSIACLYIPRQLQRGGLGTALIEAAVAHARANGARTVEAYGVEPGDGDPFTGFRAMYETAGFGVVRPGGRRSIMRLELSQR